MAPTIVCGVDTTREAERALDVGADLARRLNARLVIAHVTWPADLLAHHPPVGGGVMPLAPYPAGSWTAGAADEHLDAARREVERLASQHGTQDADVEIAVEASTADGLRRVARDRGADLLVVGSRGRGSAAGALLGSTSHALVAEAPCPVVVVPPPEDA